MIVASNTTPLIGLASIERISLLQNLFAEVHISRAVYNEVLAAGKDKKKRKGVNEITTADWIKAVPVNDNLAVEVLLDELDLGESETIILARELGAEWVIMDEKKGRRKLDQLGLNKIGTVGVLLKAKELKLIPQIRPELERLQQSGFSLSQFVFEMAVQQAGE
jgi:predicted nucleic acid-binding protein